MNIYELLRPFLFALPPELAHQLTLNALRWYGYASVKNEHDAKFNVGGLQVSNRVGLAAGFDKDGIAIRGLSKLGFGFLEFGAVTPRAQAGNARPRVFRLRKDFALINRLGFNNQGIDALIQKIVNDKQHVHVPIGINIGKNFDTPFERAIDDYEYCFARANSLVDFVTLNVSSPNTPQLRNLQATDPIKRLLTRLVGLRDANADREALRTLILVKISPDLSEDETNNLCSVIRTAGVDGIIATNTTLSHQNLRAQDQTGGLSGRPLFPLALKCVRQARSTLGAGFLIVGCGGIWNVESAQQMRDAGADLLQIYTGLVYHGLSSLKEISQIN